MAENQETIILADDDEDDRMFFLMAVDQIARNIKLITFNDGVELVKYIQNESEVPAMLYMDINMPKLTGLECLKEVRKSVYWKDVPVAMYSTSGNETDIYNARESGAQVFVIKQFEVSKLAAIIEWTLKIDWKNTVLSPSEFFVTAKTGDNLQKSL